jgi:hypothetical protein
MPGAPIYLQANRDYYVSNSGSDSADGSAGTPWATLKHAADFLQRFNLNNFTINVHVADGTYAPVTLRALYGSGNVNWIGNPATPLNCVVAGVSTTCWTVGNAGGSHTLSGFSQTISGPYNGSDLQIGVHVFGAGTSVTMNNMAWGPCAGYHYSVEGSGASLLITGTETVYGGCVGSTGGTGAHARISNGGQLQTPTTIALTITAAVSFASGWFVATGVCLGQILYSAITGGGLVTGKRYDAQQNAVISTNGGGANYYPGTVAGTSTTGLYV